jgi:hypothetical protein
MPPLMPRALAVLALLAATTASATLAVGCDPSERVPAKEPKPRPCPPPPEPTYQATVVGTIGKMHMVESRYPLSRLGDVLASFKPDLVLVAVRVDPYREGHLEDASFEMTYVTNLARQHGAAVEPIDWFREQDLGAPPAAVEPWDEAEIAKREAEVLASPKLYNFDVANGTELAEKVLLATDAEARHRSGNPLVSRRHAWMQQLAGSAVSRNGRPKRVLAYVDVLDRPIVDHLLHGVGYTMKEPPAVAAKSKDEIIADIPVDVINDWRAQLGRAGARIESAKTPGEKAFWADRQRTLSVVVDKKAACCVPQSSLAADK